MMNQSVVTKTVVRHKAHETDQQQANGKAARMTDEALLFEEQLGLLAGLDDWHIAGVPRLGIPTVRVTDCGHGVTLCGDRASAATCFPTGIGMASTWNARLLEEVGEALGRETRALGCSVLLGPMINLHRIPLNGRSFETFSEDPVLAGRLGAAVIRGIQRTGVAACVKSLVANNQQENQTTASVEADERTLRELYLRAFEIAISEGAPAMIMTAYNALNGKATSEHHWLLTRIAKGEWGFEGPIVSDWRAVKSARVYGSGLDLEMPGPGKFLHVAGVKQALSDGAISRDQVTDQAQRVAGLLRRYGRDENDVTSTEAAALDCPQHRDLARRVAEESIVLLKNDGDLLPLDLTECKRVLVVGPNAATARLGGGGSASVTPSYAISPLEGLRQAIRRVAGERVTVDYVEGCGIVGDMEAIDGALLHCDDGNGGTLAGWRAEFFNSGRPEGTPDATEILSRTDLSWGWASPARGVLRTSYAVRLCGYVTPPVDGRYQLGVCAQEGWTRLWVDGVLVCDRWENGDKSFESEFINQQASAQVELRAGVPVQIRLEYAKRAARAAVRLEWRIPGATDPARRACALAAKADVVIACCGMSNLLEGGARDRRSMDLPAAQVHLIESLARANARTIVVLVNGGPVAMPWEPLVPALLEAWYPGQEGGRALARILLGEVNPSGRLPDTLAYRLGDHASAAHYPGDHQHINYAEGLAVGYRHFDTAGIEPHYPFGYGLSYTRFDVSAPRLGQQSARAGEPVKVEASVTNLGKRSGALTVQLYVRPINPPVQRPVQELKAFEKIFLRPGERRTVCFTLIARDFAYYDTTTHEWRVAPGAYGIFVGEHSRSLTGATITLI